MFINILLLSLATAIWGFGFIATRWMFQGFDPVWTNALRFSIAGIVGLPFLFYKNSFFRKENNITKKAMLSALFLLGAILFQTMGLVTTTVAKSGFITTLYALFIPLTLMVLTGKKFKRTFWLLIFMALVGIALMCNLEIKNLNGGDFLTLLCAFSAAFQITYIGTIAKEIQSPVEFNFLQNFFCAIFSVAIAFIFKGRVSLSPLEDTHSQVFYSLLFLGIVSSMIAFTIQVIAQKKIPAQIAGIIFLMESPFAAVFGFFIFNERLSLMNMIGAGLILLSVVLVTIHGKKVATLAKESDH